MAFTLHAYCNNGLYRPISTNGFYSIDLFQRMVFTLQTYFNQWFLQAYFNQWPLLNRFISTNSLHFYRSISTNGLYSTDLFQTMAFTLQAYCNEWSLQAYFNQWLLLYRPISTNGLYSTDLFQPMVFTGLFQPMAFTLQIYFNHGLYSEIYFKHLTQIDRPWMPTHCATAALKAEISISYG